MSTLTKLSTLSTLKNDKNLQRKIATLARRYYDTRHDEDVNYQDETQSQIILESVNLLLDQEIVELPAMEYDEEFKIYYSPGFEFIDRINLTWLNEYVNRVRDVLKRISNDNNKDKEKTGVDDVKLDRFTKIAEKLNIPIYVDDGKIKIDYRQVQKLDKLDGKQRIPDEFFFVDHNTITDEMILDGIYKNLDE